MDYKRFKDTCQTDICTETTPNLKHVFNSLIDLLSSDVYPEWNPAK